MALHVALRLLFVHAYCNHYRSRIAVPGALPRVAWYAVVPLHYAELTALLGLTYVSSTENLAFHEAMFILFVSASFAYMFVSIYLSRIALPPDPTDAETAAMRYKTWAFLSYVTSLLLAVYFYYRHQAHCEPYVYSVFAACEYIVVLSNVAFHGTLPCDLPGYSFNVTRRRVSKRM